MIGLVLGLLVGSGATWLVLDHATAAAVRGQRGLRAAAQDHHRPWRRGTPASFTATGSRRRAGIGVGVGVGDDVRAAAGASRKHGAGRFGGIADADSFHHTGRIDRAVHVATRVVEGVGRGVRGVVGRAGEPRADRRIGLVVLSGLLLVGVHPVLAVAPLLGAVVAPPLAARRRARRHTATVVDELPDVVDLLRLTTSAGLTVTAAVTAIGGRPGGVIGAAFVRAAAQIAHGGTTADALAVLHAAGGSSIRPLVDALADHDRYGTALGPALDRLAVETRLQRRRQAEEAARRLPVSLLFPLVLTVLPAYVMLTIVPLLAGSFSSLHL